MANQIKLKDQFITIRNKISDVYNYELFEQKHESVHYFLYDAITSAHSDSIKLIKSIEGEPTEILLQINQFIVLLKRDIQIKLASQNRIRNKLGKRLNDFVESLEELKLTFPESNNVPQTGDVKEKTRKKQAVYDYNKPVIKQSQVLLLMHYLRKNAVLIRDIDDSTLSDCFGTLTGFSTEQLRKKYVDFKKNDVKYKPAEINELKELLVKISKDVSDHQ